MAQAARLWLEASILRIRGSSLESVQHVLSRLVVDSRLGMREKRQTLDLRSAQRDPRLALPGRRTSSPPQTHPTSEGAGMGVSLDREEIPMRPQVRETRLERMVYEIEFTDSGPFDVIVTTSGVPSLLELEAGRRRVLADPRFRPGMKVLIDHSHLEIPAGTSAEEVRMFAASHARDRAASCGYFLAAVAPTTLSFGLGRMWEASIGEGLENDTTIVRSRAEADEWIERVTGNLHAVHAPPSGV